MASRSRNRPITFKLFNFVPSAFVLVNIFDIDVVLIRFSCKLHTGFIYIELKAASNTK